MRSRAERMARLARMVSGPVTLYLIDLEERVVRTWESDLTAGLIASLLETPRLVPGGTRVHSDAASKP